MFDYIYQWIRNLAFYLVLATAVLQVIPGSDYKKYIRFFTGLVLVIMMMTPVLKLFGMEDSLKDYYNYAEYRWKIEEMENAAKYLEGIDSAEYLGNIGSADNNDEKDEDGKIDVEEIEIGK